MTEISVTDIGPVRIGQVENVRAGTGCTVFISDAGMHAGIDVRGGGPASRETFLLNPITAAQRIHGVVLAGGSAFGLSAAGGVMKYLKERGIGLDVGVTKVPLVVQSDIFDLTVAEPDVYPDEAMGYEAAKKAFESPNYKDGNYGAGCGATVGKLCGMERCMKTGMGSYAVQLGELKIGAVVVLNALGDVFDWKNGRQIAGMRTPDGKAFSGSPHEMRQSMENARSIVENTTLGVIMTNARFHKGSLCKIAGMGQDGYARSIRPVHTSLDGDTVYALSVGDVSADREVVGLLASEVISEAIIRAVTNAESAYGFPAAKDLK
ncbi:MAG: P1 family peptidase [Clostridia bacterium]|nr:P1 family peptidase [Clostridia bacterium]